MKKFTKIALIVASFVLVAALSVGGTLAWLTAKTQVVTNTFVDAGIEITLDEGEVWETTDTIPEGGELGKFKNEDKTPRVNANVYQAIPGSVYDKDPIVTVKAESEECYLFVEFTEGANTDDYYTYTSLLNADNGWLQDEGIPKNVWYRIVPASSQDQPFHLLDGDKITVKNTVTNDNMDAATAETIKLSWIAYAVQTANVADAATAWTYRPGATT